MKNVVIAALILICVGLLLRGPKVVQVAAPKVAGAVPSAQTVSGPPTEISPPQKAVREDSLSASHRVRAQERLEARLAALKEVVWRYSRYLAKAGFSREKTELLLDLLVDEKLAAIEADIQLGREAPGALTQAQVDEAARMDRKMIEDLVGPDAARDLYQSGLDETLRTPSRGAMQVVDSHGLVAPEQRAQINDVLRGYNPQQGFDTIINSHQEVTATVEQQFRASQAARLEAVIERLTGAISPEQATALREWSRQEADKAIEFAKVYWISNHRKG